MPRPDTVNPALPAGNNRDRIRLWDRQYRPIWDSATATTGAYQHINDWVNASIDYPDGQRWTGQFYRCPEGIGRSSIGDLTKLEWPENPIIEQYFAEPNSPYTLDAAPMPWCPRCFRYHAGRCRTHATP